MSLQAINYAMTQPVEETGARLLLFIIAHHVHWETGVMFVTQAQLAEEIRASERSVRRWLDVLEADGYIARKECRGDQGRRLPDEIELIGYLEWQRVLYEGGTIRAPKARSKRVDNYEEKQPDNLAGSDADNRTLLSGIDRSEQPDNLAGTNRTNQGPQPDKKGGPTGQLCPVYNNHLQPLSTTISARAGACEASASPARAEAPAPVEVAAWQPGQACVVRTGQPSWRKWLETIPPTLAVLVERDAEATAIVVTAPWPGKDSRLLGYLDADGTAHWTPNALRGAGNTVSGGGA